MSQFPACKHRKTSTHPAGSGVAAWLAAEPFRVFFFSGAVWSIIGVALWPLWYAQKLTFYPSPVHARLMIECFGGAFVAGFLGTAGPRMATAPKLTVPELLALFALHTATGVLHLHLRHHEADTCFLATLSLLALALIGRVALYRKEAPPPQMLLALAGLGCGIAGALRWRQPDGVLDPLAGLLVYQGLLLLPVMGIGSFLFPRILGGDFGAPEGKRARRFSLLRAITAAALIVGSFFLETAGHITPAYLLRAATAAVYLLIEVPWRRAPGSPPRGTMANGLLWALLTGLAALVSIAFLYPHRTGLEHLLFIGTFGLLILIVGSRVLFGHSGELESFAKKSWMGRTLIALAIVAATTRAVPEFVPQITVSHHKYAAEAWALACLLWILWHRRRFLKRDTE